MPRGLLPGLRGAELVRWLDFIGFYFLRGPLGEESMCLSRKHVILPFQNTFHIGKLARELAAWQANGFLRRPEEMEPL
ncbi:MAG: hypothetical protein WD740_00535, partial [Anaerolineales bacterium]